MDACCTDIEDREVEVGAFLGALVDIVAGIETAVPAVVVVQQIDHL